MDTNNQLLIDNRYRQGLYNDNQSFSKQSKIQEELLNKDPDNVGLFGRRVYLESPSFDNKEEEDMYRYVSSRLSNRTTSVIGAKPLQEPTSGALIDSLDIELDVHNLNHTRPTVPIRNEPYSVAPRQPLSNTLANVPRPDPRQDPLLGPLLAELDSMASQQQQTLAKSSAPAIYRQNSRPYESNLIRPSLSSQTNSNLTNIANRTVNEALLNAELYDSLNPIDQQQQHPINSSNYSQPQQPNHLPNMNSSDIFFNSHYSDEPDAFLNNFRSEDHLFQRPLLNNISQNYVPYKRPSLPQQSDPTFEQTRTRISPVQRTSYAPGPYAPTNQFSEPQRSPPQRTANPSNNQELFFTDHNDDPYEQNQSFLATQRTNNQQDPDSKRQAIWNELQRTSAKTQEKNSKKRDFPNRPKGTFGSSGHQPSPFNRSPQRPIHQPPPFPPPVQRMSYPEDISDFTKNKENFYNRYPTQKYDNTYSNRKDSQGGVGNERPEYDTKVFSPPSNNPPRQTSLPVMINLNTNGNSQNGSLPGQISIPIESQVNRNGDKISVNIDLNMADIQNLTQQQQQQQYHHHQQPQQHYVEQPQWSNLDTLDRHIRKLERNMDQSLPIPNPPQRSPIIQSTGVNRQGKTTSGSNRSGYNPPVYSGDPYHYGDREQEEDSYLSRLNYTRKSPNFKPYTTRDYEQFKKNFGFGSTHLFHDYDRTTHKEKVEMMAKTKEYAQQIEARNKKKLSTISRRTLSDTRLPAETYNKPLRLSGYTPTLTRPKQYSGNSTHSSPPTLNTFLPLIPGRRPTEVLHKPPPVPKQITQIAQHENNPVVEPISFNNEQEKFSRNSSQISRDHLSIDKQTTNNIQRSIPNQTNQQRLSPTKIVRTSSLTDAENKRRPLKFD